MNSNNFNSNAAKQPSVLPVRHLYCALHRKLNQARPRIDMPAALAHEVRNPLTSIDLAIDMLSENIYDSDQQVLVDIIKRASSRINGLITALLTSTAAANTHSGNHSINQLLDKVLTIADDRIRLKNICVTREYSPIGCEIWMDKRQMEIALTNIVINAVEAMAANAGKLKLVTQSVNGFCSIAIEDNGRGIAKENLANIFEPFFTRKLGGMGIGLSTSLEILRANHVRVEVTSEPDRGTRFLLSFERPGSQSKMPA